jgi:hypothetical protein
MTTRLGRHRPPRHDAEDAAARTPPDSGDPHWGWQESPPPGHCESRLMVLISMGTLSQIFPVNADIRWISGCLG